MTVLLSRQRLKQRLGGLRRRGWSTQSGRPKGLFPLAGRRRVRKILGHVILSYVALDTGQRLLELGPLSVCPERQGQGIGGDLVRTALGIADELNEPLVLVLGFPAYYRRFGFQRASAFGIAPPDGIPDDAWMAVTLSSYSPALRGKVIWPPAFSGVT